MTLLQLYLYIPEMNSSNLRWILLSAES